MSIYHCSIKIISRSDGKSAVASSAYRSGEKLMDDRTGLVHDFTKKRGVVFTEVALPAHAPPEYADRNVLWNAVEKAEKKSNAQLAREIEVALPKELSRECQIEIVRRYVQDNFVSVIPNFPAITDSSFGVFSQNISSSEKYSYTVFFLSSSGISCGR